MSITGASLIGSCIRKARYGSERRARSVATKCKELRGVNLRVYWCGLCGGFHLTHHRALLEPDEDLDARSAVPDVTVEELLDRRAAKAAERAAKQVAEAQRRREEKQAARHTEAQRQAATFLRKHGWTVTEPTP